MWNLRNKADEHRGRERKINKIKTEREANHKRLLTIELKLRVAGEKVGGWAKWVLGIKEGT